MKLILPLKYTFCSLFFILWSMNSLAAPPVLSAIESTTLNYIENAAPTQITDAILVEDDDDTNLEFATVVISSGYQNGQDMLSFTNANGIAGTWIPATGTMLLTGSSLVANYQTALRNVSYANTSDNPSTVLRVISFTVNDGDGNSNTVTRNLSVTAQNDPPVLSAVESSTLDYIENAAPTQITNAILVEDDDDTHLESATVVISSEYQNGQDILSFTNANGITGTWIPATGTMSLTGTSLVANYRTALRNVRYANTSDNPSTVLRVISFTVNDGDVNSNTVTRNLSVTAQNDPPVLSAVEITTLNYIENAAPTQITNEIIVLDDDDTNFESAIVVISSGYQNGQDILSFTNANGIAGTWIPATGTMLLTGSSLVANYQTALRNVRYANISDNPSTVLRVISFTVNDGDINSNTVTRNLSVTAQNDPPELSGIEIAALPYTEGDPATIITSSIVVNDVDNANLVSATVKINTGLVSAEDVLSLTGTTFTVSYTAATGTLTITGSGDLSTYQDALRNVKYRNTNTTNPSLTTRTVTFTVNDGTVASNTVSRDVTFSGVNNPPVLSAIEGSTLPYIENAAPTPVTSSILVVDPDDTNLESAAVTITSGYQNGEDTLIFTTANGITGAWIAATGTMSLTGTSLVVNYRSALRNVRYANTSDNPSIGTRTVSFTVNDGDVNSNIQTRNLTITPENDPPVLDGIEPTTLVYAENDPPTSITTLIEVTDPDDTYLESATVSITSGYHNVDDSLIYTNANGINGTWNDASGIMTLTGHSLVANYQTALRNVRYVNTSENPSTGTRTVSFSANDGNATSSIITRSLSVTRVNDPPVLDAIETSTLVYTENSDPTSITTSIEVTDPDDTYLEGAIVAIISGYHNTDDSLIFTNANGISGSWNDVSGTMTLTGHSLVANYQTALRNVQYVNTSENPSTGTRIVSFTVNDGDGNSNAQTRNLTITQQNDPPVITSDGGGPTASITILENTTAVTTVTATDVDVPTVLTYSISGGADQSLFSINASSGVLTFDSAPDYENPTDNGGNNVYDVQVTVTDDGVGNLTDMQAIAVTVQDDNGEPTARISGNDTVCNDGEAAELTVTLTGENPPWSFKYTINETDETEVTDVMVSNYTLPVNQVGVYELTNVSDDKYNKGSVSGTGNVLLYTHPTAVFTEGAEQCEQLQNRLSFTLTGTAPWSISYRYESETPVPVSNILTSPHIISVEDIGTYSLLSVSDKNCPGTATGTIEIIPAPEVTIGGLRSTTYSLGSKPDTIDVNPFGGNFDESDSRYAIIPNEGLWLFYPNIAYSFGSPFWIRYAYQDPGTSCVGKDSVRVLIIQDAAEIQIENEKSMYCFNDDPIEVLGANIRNNIGHFSITNNIGLIDSANNRAYVLPSVIKEGYRTVTYTVNIDGIDETAEKLLYFNYIDGDFTWDNECFDGQSIVNFTDQSESDRDITGHQWNIYLPNDTVIKYTPQSTHTFNNQATYPIELIASTQNITTADTNYCYDTLKKDLILKPTFAVNGLPVIEDFQDGSSFWYPFAIEKDSTNTWAFGSPQGEIFNAIASEKAWYTKITTPNLNKSENSYVISPCFDFSDSQRPMLKMDIWRGFMNVPDLDGAVVQYTTNNGVQWENLGNIGDGIEWYDSYKIFGEPAGQKLGWTNSQDGDWTEVRHKLDELTGKSRVRFRIAYGAPEGYAGVERDGIAFDDLWIGERSKKVLIEHFTNAGSPDCKTVNEAFNAIMNNNLNIKDIIDIQYHLGHPGPDPFYDLNPVPPNSRELYYAIPSVPYGIIDGGRGSLPAFLIDYSAHELVQNDLTVAALADNIFSIDIQALRGSNSLDITITITALEDIPQKYLTLHTVIIENLVTGITGENGETSFESVMKTMLPDAGGISFNRSWTAGAEEKRNLRYDYENVYTETQLRVVTFIQDEPSKTIYQANTINPFSITGTDPNEAGAGSNFILFPNPASSVTYVKLNDYSAVDLKLELINSEGRVIYNRVVKQGEKIIPISLNTLDAGLYFVRLISDKEILGTERLIHLGNK